MPYTEEQKTQMMQSAREKMGTPIPGQAIQQGKKINILKMLSSGMSEQDINTAVLKLKSQGNFVDKNDVEKYKILVENQKKERAKNLATNNESKKSLFKGVADFFISSEKKFGQTLGDVFAVITGTEKQRREAELSEAEADLQKAKLLRTATFEQQEKIKSQLKIGKLVPTVEEVIPSVGKSAKQIYGEGLGVAADIASFGTYGTGAKGMATGVLGKIAKPTLTTKLGVNTAKQAFVSGFIKKAPEAAALSAAFGVSYSMQDDENLKEIIESGAKSGLIGGVIGGLLGGISERHKFLEPQRIMDKKKEAIEIYTKGLRATKEKYKEQAEKIVPDLLEQKTWGRAKTLLKKAEKGIELSNEEYKKLGELQGFIEIDGIIDIIEKESANYITPGGTILSTGKTKYNTLQNLKADILSYKAYDDLVALGTDKGVKFSNIAYQENLRKLAQQYGDVLYETRKSIQTVEDSKTLSQVKKVDAAIRDLLATKNPEYAKINKVYHLNTELQEILTETARRKAPQNWVSLANSIAIGIGSIVGLGVGHGVKGSILGAGALYGLSIILESTWFNTLKGVQKARFADKLLLMPLSTRLQAIQVLSRSGAKTLPQFLEDDQIDDKSNK